VTGASIRARGNVALEARWDVPDDAVRVMVLCHPHPLHGGTMRVPLLNGVTKVLLAGATAVLRFNFRGVEGSTGRWSGGIDEIDDIAAAVDAARELFPDLPLAVGGWSFGAATSLRWMARDREDLPWVGIAPPVSSELTPGLPPRSSLGEARRTFIVGDRDQFITVDEIEAYAAAVGGTVHVIRGSDHFFYFRHDRVGELVLEGLPTQVPEPPGSESTA
jgi:alpha/beta superfamily hydrolase